MLVKRLAAALLGVTCLSPLLPDPIRAESAPATASNESMAGVWLTKDNRSQVEIAPCGDSLCGTIVWLRPKSDGTPSTTRDKRNSDPALRDRPLLGLQIMSGFRPDGPNEWSDGKIYNPDDGRTYEPTLSLRGDGTLKLEACILFICQSEVWQKVE
ncbi:MAG: DUF2147 domain-containing protein [Kiloniellales bacterium]